jgi:hypothetical protein
MPFRLCFRIAGQYQPSHHLPASITISPHTTPTSVDRRAAIKAANPAATAA